MRSDAARGRPVRRPQTRIERLVGPAPPVVGLDLLKTLFTGRNVLVLGSAPLAAPVKPARHELVVCINGSVSSLPNRAPDLWLVNSRIKPMDQWGHERRFLHKTMMAQAAGRHVRVVGFMTRMHQAEHYTAAWMAEQGTTFDQALVIDRHQRESIEVHAGIRTIAMRRDACSAGLFGVIVALWAGAWHVRMDGFSFKKGYHYLPGHTLPENCRAHVQGDRLALREMAQRYTGRVDGALLHRQDVTA